MSYVQANNFLMSDASYVVGAGPFFSFKPILYVLIALKTFSDVQANNNVICAGKTPTWYVQSNFFLSMQYCMR
jgi:hypothetical protein